MDTPTTSDRVFSAFAAELELKDRKQPLVAKRSDEVIKHLKKLGVKIQSSQVIGSYARRTLIPPLAAGDIDLIVELDPRAHHLWNNSEGATNLPSKFASALRKAYSHSNITTDSHATLIQLNEFRLDVIPAFGWHSGGFLIPDAQRGVWIHADPIPFAEEVERLDRRRHGVVLPVIRMARAWSRNAGHLLQGFHIECLTLCHFNALDATPASYEEAIGGFFQVLPDLLRDRCREPVHDQIVDDYLDEGERYATRRDRAVEKAEDAADLARFAHQESRTGADRTALAGWNQLFGSTFRA